MEDDVELGCCREGGGRVGFLGSFCFSLGAVIVLLGNWNRLLLHLPAAFMNLARRFFPESGRSGLREDDEMVERWSDISQLLAWLEHWEVMARFLATAAREDAFVELEPRESVVAMEARWPSQPQLYDWVTVEFAMVG